MIKIYYCDYLLIFNFQYVLEFNYFSDKINT